jgi:hypothetical protein
VTVSIFKFFGFSVFVVCDEVVVDDEVGVEVDAVEDCRRSKVDVGVD